MTFQEALKELREIAGKKYHALMYDLSEHFDGEQEVECQIYIEGHSFFVAPTWRQALDKARVKLGVDEKKKPDLTEAPDFDKMPEDPYKRVLFNLTDEEKRPNHLDK